MSRKIFVATALAVCLGLVFAAISAGDRTRSRDRTARTSFARIGAPVDIQDTFGDQFRRTVPGIPVTIIGAGGGSGTLAAVQDRFGSTSVDKASAYLQFAANQDRLTGGVDSRDGHPRVPDVSCRQVLYVN